MIFSDFPSRCFSSPTIYSPWFVLLTIFCSSEKMFSIYSPQLGASTHADCFRKRATRKPAQFPSLQPDPIRLPLPHPLHRTPINVPFAAVQMSVIRIWNSGIAPVATAIIATAKIILATTSILNKDIAPGTKVPGAKF